MKRELGTLERAFVIADQYAPLQIVSVLHLEKAPPAHLLKQALKVLQNRQPFLGACLHKEKGKYYFESLVEPDIPFHFLPRWNAEHWIFVAETELANRIDTAGGPLFRCTYLYDAANGHADIILSFCHFIMDASSVSQFMHELLTICASFIDQRTIPIYGLPPTPPVESRFPPAFRGLGLKMQILPYAFQQMADELGYRIKTRDKRIPPLHLKSGRGHILSIELPEDLLESFAQRARKEGVTLNSALNVVLMLAVNRNLYAGQPVPMRTYSFVNLRPYVQPPLRDEEMACYISPLRYSVSVAGGIGFWSLARDLHAKAYSSLKSGDKFVAAALAEPLTKMLTHFKSLRIGSTMLNYNGLVSVQPNYDDIKVIGLHDFISAYDLGPEFAAQAQIFNRRLFLDFTYLEADVSRNEATAIVEEMKNILHSAIADGEATNQSAL